MLVPLLLGLAAPVLARDYLLTPEYFLIGAADFLYLSERTTANGTATAAESARQRYSLGLNGPIIGPLIGNFSLNGNLSRSSVTVDTSELTGDNYAFNGRTDLFPTGKLRFSLYYDMAKISTDSLGLQSASDTKSYGLTFNPRLFRGVTLITYDHTDSTGSVAQRTSFAETRDRGTLFYSDNRRYKNEGRLSYQYQATLLTDTRTNGDDGQSLTDLDNRLLASYYQKFGAATQWSNSLAGDYGRRTGSAATSTGSYGSGRFESSLTHDFSKEIRGYLTLDHSSVKTIDTDLFNAEVLTATGLYSNVPNLIPHLRLNLQGSVGWSSQWEKDRQSLNGSLASLSRWSGSPYFDVLNDLAYSYQSTLGNDIGDTSSVSSTQAGSRREAVDALAYRFGLQGKGTRFNWYTDFTFQQLGLLTAPTGAGSQQTFTVGMTAAGIDLNSQSFYTFTKTDIPGDDLHTLQHLIRSTTTYRFNRFLDAQLVPYLLQTTVLTNGVENDSTSMNLGLNLNWNPFPRLAMTGGGDLSRSRGTAGDGYAFAVRSALTYIFPFFNLSLSYRYQQAAQTSPTGNFNSTDSRVELTAGTSFGFRLGSFAPKGNY